MINYGKQYLDTRDIKAVIKVLKNDLITQGPEVIKFENKIKNKFGSKYCNVVSSGTAALHLSGMALAWKKNDIILTSPIGFLASANTIVYNNAKPDFVDIDPSTYNIDPNKAEDKVKYYLKKKKRVKAIIAIDYAGRPCDWKSLNQISNKYGIKLINDNCHAIGAKYSNEISYASKYADIVTHSYHPVKNITTGEGGAVLTNNKEIFEKIKTLRSHGMIKKSTKKEFKNKPWFYEMKELGFNYRISDIQCALGISQLNKLNKFIKKRNYIAKIYNSFFNDTDLFTTPQVQENSIHAFHLYPLLINFKKSKISKEILFKKLRKKGILPQVHYIPIHLQPFYKKKYDFRKGDYPEAEKFYDQEISLPIFYSLKYNDVKFISETILKNI